MQSISNSMGIRGFLDCDHKSFTVYPKDKITIKAPTDNYTIGHQCPKIDVYRKFMALPRVYVLKGDLKAKILKYAKIKKKSKSKVEET